MAPMKTTAVGDKPAARTWHQDALTALGLAIGAAVALGFSRFAYALLLPPMRDALGWNYVEAGALNTANGAGYIVGALASTWFARRGGTALYFQLALLMSVLVLLATAATADFTSLLVLRTIGGMVTAVTFILGAALAGSISSDRQSQRGSFLRSLYFAGASAGIVLSGIAVPIALGPAGSGWREGWVALGLLGLLGLVPASLAARSVAPAAGGAAAILNLRDLRQLLPTLLSYTLFGAGYVGYMTFIIALLRSNGGGGLSTAFWLVLGTVSTITTLLWVRVLGRMRGGRGPALVFIIAAIGTLPVLIRPEPAAAFVSAVIFGSSFIAGPAAVTVVARQQLEAAALTAGIATLTILFALGQAIGPLLAGAATDITHDVAAGLWLSPALLGLAAILAVAQRPVRL
jgi:predicted MFS family arabinose efflux permease